MIDHLDKIYYVATDKKIHQYYRSGNTWAYAPLNLGAPKNVRVKGGLNKK